MRRRQSRYQGQYPPKFSRVHEDTDYLWVTRFPARYMFGIIGERCAGKSLMVSYLSDQAGFEVYSMMSLVREVAEERGLQLDDRRLLQMLGDELRSEHRNPETGELGDGAYLARLVLRRIHQRYHSHLGQATAAPRIAITGFKHPDELDLFLRMSNFSALVLRADVEPRAHRAQRNEVLQKALRDQGREDLAVELSAECELESVDPAAFTTYIDNADLHGRDPNNQLLSPWAGSSAQSVSGLMARALEEDGKQSEPPGNSDVDRRVYLLANGPDRKLDALYADVREIVDRHDRKYRATLA